MKHTIRLVLLPALFLGLSLLYATPEYEIEITPHWQDLENSSQKSQQFGGKWIWVATLTFKKRSKEPIFIDSLDIQWKGQSIKNLTGTLFEKDPDKTLSPVEEAVVSDGKWNSKQQFLHFTFNKKIKLNPLHNFCLVLTIPKNLENILKRGTFTVRRKTLPLKFRANTSSKILSFSVHPPKKIKHSKKIAYHAF